VAGHLLLELAFAPSRHSRAPRSSDGPRPSAIAFSTSIVPVIAKTSLRAVDVERVLPAPVGRVQDEARAGLDRAAMMDGAVRRLAGIDVELLEKPRNRSPARLWPIPIPTAPFSSWTHIAITARSNRGSDIPGIARSSLPERKGGCPRAHDGLRAAGRGKA
jgi:hypothetical protein